MDSANPESQLLDDLSINKLALNSETQGGARYYYLESTIERAEIPYVSDDYVLRMAISTQLDIAAAIIDLGMNQNSQIVLQQKMELTLSKFRLSEKWRLWVFEEKIERRSFKDFMLRYDSL